MSDGSPRAHVERTRTPRGAQVATLTLDHQPLNLFDQKMMDSLRAHISEISADCPRALVIRAQGRLTSAGVDVNLFAGLDSDQATGMWRGLIDEVIYPIERLSCPVIFAAKGLTLTAAFEIALACDFILATPEAQFGLIERTIGLTPSMGGPQRLAERAGSGRARELIMTGATYDATTMAAWGVVNAVCSNLDEATTSLAHQLADGPTLAHAATKKLIMAWRAGGSAIADQLTPDVSGSLFATNDLKSGVANFLTDGPRHGTNYTGT
ncbi:enoyl-CoA hydratase/isomerase family protein [Mycolicibacterium fortuitum]|uniref:enoyl-CoA hydratase/isomerase family protein n=1 Tax=Mycolicibacterium fortuitum TaxID=1766 RepID=UPI00261AEEE7|nr:enoyl-CoA hydratase/isomerase family protein [Mycolicibacterium fortuitum]